MKIITMARASELLGDPTSRTGKEFAKKHRLALIDTDAKHGKGRAIFFDEAEVIARAAERNKPKDIARPTGHPSQLAHRKIRTVARALVGLYELLGEQAPEQLRTVAEHDYKSRRWCDGGRSDRAAPPQNSST